jgi:hypothetical protein
MSKEQQQRQTQRELAKWRVMFSGCNHVATLTDKELHNPIEQQFNPATLHEKK